MGYLGGSHLKKKTSCFTLFFFFGVPSHSVREQAVPALGTCTGAQICQACSCFLGQTNRNCTTVC